MGKIGVKKLKRLSDERLERKALLESQTLHLSTHSPQPAEARNLFQASQPIGGPVMAAQPASGDLPGRNKYGVLTLNFPGLVLYHYVRDNKNKWQMFRRQYASNENNVVNQSLPAETVAKEILNREYSLTNRK